MTRSSLSLPMSPAMSLANAVKFINRKGVLLVFPQENRKEPPSLWYEFFPNSKMRWEWDSGGDNRVSDLWHLRERLSTSRKVIYGKFYRDKATVLSMELFAALLKLLNPGFPEVRGLSFQSREILDLLDEDSPLSTKQLKKVSGLQGKASETAYTRALRELWSRHLIVAFGEVDEGAFPSIAVGSTRVIFEDVWKTAESYTISEAENVIESKLSGDATFAKYYRAQRKKMADLSQSLER